MLLGGWVGPLMSLGLRGTLSPENEAENSIQFTQSFIHGNLLTRRMG